jgi:hypothetical protein
MKGMSPPRFPAAMLTRDEDFLPALDDPYRPLIARFELVKFNQFEHPLVPPGVDVARLPLKAYITISI